MTQLATDFERPTGSYFNHIDVDQHKYQYKQQHKQLQTCDDTYPLSSASMYTSRSGHSNEDDMRSRVVFRAITETLLNLEYQLKVWRRQTCRRLNSIDNRLHRCERVISIVTKKKPELFENPQGNNNNNNNNIRTGSPYMSTRRTMHTDCDDLKPHNDNRNTNINNINNNNNSDNSTEESELHGIHATLTSLCAKVAGQCENRGPQYQYLHTTEKPHTTHDNKMKTEPKIINPTRENSINNAYSLQLGSNNNSSGDDDFLTVKQTTTTMGDATPVMFDSNSNNNNNYYNNNNTTSNSAGLTPDNAKTPGTVMSTQCKQYNSHYSHYKQEEEEYESYSNHITPLHQQTNNTNRSGHSRTALSSSPFIQNTPKPDSIPLRGVRAAATAPSTALRRQLMYSPDSATPAQLSKYEKSEGRYNCPVIECTQEEEEEEIEIEEEGGGRESGRSSAGIVVLGSYIRRDAESNNYNNNNNNNNNIVPCAPPLYMVPQELYSSSCTESTVNLQDNNNSNNNNNSEINHHNSPSVTSNIMGIPPTTLAVQSVWYKVVALAHAEQQQQLMQNLIHPAVSILSSGMPDVSASTT